MDWWTGHRNRFDLFVSILVLEEVARGEQNVAALRMAQLEGLATLEMTEEARELARQFVIRGLLPAKAFEDALHVAIATIQGMDYLLTWNCRHIANAEIAGRMATLAEELGYEMPTLCTPEQLMGD